MHKLLLPIIIPRRNGHDGPSIVPYQGKRRESASKEFRFERMGLKHCNRKEREDKSGPVVAWGILISLK